MKKKDPFPVLYAPDSFVNATPAVRAAAVNGCGTGGWLAALVPETMYGLSVAAACNIHDWMYKEGSTWEDKREADRVFLNNLMRIIEFETRWGWLKWLRRRRALKYYNAVKYCGGPAFWKGKNADKNEIWSTTAELAVAP